VLAGFVYGDIYMARRPYAALGTFTTKHGTVIVRKLFARSQDTWLLVLEGPHLALRMLLPDWQPRSPGTRTQITPPAAIKKVSAITSFYQDMLPIWLERAKGTPAPVAIPTQSVPAYTTLGQLMDVVDHEAAAVLRTGSIVTYRHQWNCITRELPVTTLLSTITRERLQTLMNDMGTRYASTTVTNLRAALSKLLTRATEDGVLSRNPLAKVKTPRPIVRQRTFLTREQRDAVMAEASRRGRDVHLLFALMLMLGLRKSEALALTWADVDLTNRIAWIRNSDAFTTKSGNNRSIPICDELFELLRNHKQNNGFVVQPRKQASAGRYRWDFTRVFASVVRTAQAPWVTPHGARHAFASLFLAAGGSFFKLGKYLGHSTATTTELYAHAVPGYDDEINLVAQAARDHVPA
jgi:integrase